MENEFPTVYNHFELHINELKWDQDVQCLQGYFKHRYKKLCVNGVQKSIMFEYGSSFLDKEERLCDVYYPILKKNDEILKKYPNIRVIIGIVGSKGKIVKSDFTYKMPPQVLGWE